MSWIERDAVGRSAVRHARPFLTLLVAVVTGRAKRLPVALVPEQRSVALVRRDMVNHVCRRGSPDLLAHDTERVGGEVDKTRTAPPNAVASAMCRASVDADHRSVGQSRLTTRSAIVTMTGFYYA